MADSNPSDTIPEAPGTSAPEGSGNANPSEPGTGEGGGEGKPTTPHTPPKPSDPAQPGEGGEREPGTPKDVSGMSLEDINTLTGRNYKTLEDARKGVQETYKFVGKGTQESPDGTPPDGFVSREEFDTTNFYRDNPDHAKNRTLIDTMVKASRQDGNPKTPQQVVETEEYKSLAGKLKVSDEVENTRSTLTSNPRLGIVRDSAEKAKNAFQRSQEARGKGEVVVADQLQREAESNALKSVLDAYEITGEIR